MAARFAKELELKYTELSDVTVRLADVLKTVLGNDIDVDSSKTFSQMGGDSMRAIKLQQRVRDETGVVVPMNMIVGQTMMSQLADFVILKTADTDTAILSSAKLNVEALSDASMWSFESFKSLPILETVFFLTGATGFLGLYILKSLLDVGAKRIICLVRGKDDEHALHRLKESASDGQLELDWKRVVVLAGDIAEPQLGLSEEKWNRVGTECQILIHNAALVNSIMTLEQLVPTNVHSTRSCIELCASPFPAKRLLYVSTAGALYPFAARGDTVSEQRLLWEPWLERAAGGYTASKLIGEQAVYAAIDGGLCARILRPSSIAPHPVSGHFNVEDTFSRIIQACFIQSSYPRGVKAHTINLIDVEWCAQACVVTATASDPFQEICHCVAESSISWETLFDWMQDYLLSEIEPLDFNDWTMLLTKAVESTNSISKSQIMGMHRGHPLQGLMGRFKSSFPYFGDLYGRIDNDASASALGGRAPAIRKVAFFAFLKWVTDGTY